MLHISEIKIHIINFIDQGIVEIIISILNKRIDYMFGELIT